MCNVVHLGTCEVPISYIIIIISFVRRSCSYLVTCRMDESCGVASHIMVDCCIMVTIEVPRRYTIHVLGIAVGYQMAGKYAAMCRAYCHTC